jgi:UDP-N-acetyl-D-mannosaminuronic acid dehydrogenase
MLERSPADGGRREAVDAAGAAPARIAVIGLGTIGMSTAAAFAARGVAVVGVDVAPAVVAAVAANRVATDEADLTRSIRAAIESGRLRATAQVEPADVFLIAVPTPLGSDRRADLRHVDDACTALAPMLAPGNLVILESTVPVGATRRLSAALAAMRPDLSFPHVAGDAADVMVAHCPERVFPGSTIAELASNPRLAGGLAPRSARAAAEICALVSQAPVTLCDAETAEAAKLAENAFRDVNIAFANEIASVCEGLGLDPFRVIALANQHPRVKILRPGPGVGGHCIAVDPWFLIEPAPERASLMRAARAVNDAKPLAVVERIRAALPAASGGVVACLGLAYKADVGDLRESPAVEIVERLSRDPALSVRVVDPHVRGLPPALASRPNVTLLRDCAELGPVDVLALLVGHRDFTPVALAAISAGSVVDPIGIGRGG